MLDRLKAVHPLAPWGIALATLVALAVLALGLSGAIDWREGGKNRERGLITEQQVVYEVPVNERADASERPNIVFVLTDDQPLETFSRETMPVIHRELVDRGTSFTDAIVTTPLCCPARATFLTGQYAHNHGALANVPGYPDLRKPTNVLPVWMQIAGYRTAHLGKFLNNYEEVIARKRFVAPGWDVWASALAPRRYFEYKLQEDGGDPALYGSADEDYLTRVLNRRAVELIERFAGGRHPLYLQLDHYAPHNGGGGGDETCRSAAAPVPDPRDAGSAAEVPLPEPPSYDEADVSDKPSFIAGLPPIDPASRRELEVHYRCELESLRAVDRGVGEIIGALRRTGELENTVVIFASDNGYYHGQHRIADQEAKRLGYEEGLRVPYVWRVPERFAGGEPPARIATPVANIDFAPTLLELAGGRPCEDPEGVKCRTMDGRSLLGLIGGEDSGFPRDRTLVVEYSKRRGTLSCTYSGVRGQGGVLIHHTRVALDPDSKKCSDVDEYELYDLESDPFQLENRWVDGPTARSGGLQTALTAKLERLADCAGVRGRDQRSDGASFCE